MTRIRQAALVTLVVAMAVCAATAPVDAARAMPFTVRDLSGKFVRLSDFKHKKLVYMTFWATWCTPCLAELKHLRTFYQRYKAKGLVVIAVSLDGPETRAKVKPTVRRYKLSFPVVVDAEGRLVKLYNPKRTLPFSVMIKGDRIIKTRATFQVSDAPHIEKEIRNALGL